MATASPSASPMIAAPTVTVSGLSIGHLKRILRGMKPEEAARFLLSCTEIDWIDPQGRVRSLSHFERELWYAGTATSCSCPGFRKNRPCRHCWIRRLAACNPVFERGSWWITVVTDQPSMLHPGKTLTVETKWAVGLWQDAEGRLHRSCSCPTCSTHDGTPHPMHVEAVNAKAGQIPSLGERSQEQMRAEMDQRHGHLFKRRSEGLAA